MHDGGCEVLRPLWAEEAIHSIHGFTRVIRARRRRESLASQNPISARVEDLAARDLAAIFRELEIGSERALLPYRSVPRDVVSGLEALFGYPANITFKARIERVALTGYKRRTLVLAAPKLLCDGLPRSFPERDVGLIEIGLTPCGRGGRVSARGR